MCQNTNGSYECYCNSGYTLDTYNNQHCIGIHDITACIVVKLLRMMQTSMNVRASQTALWLTIKSVLTQMVLIVVTAYQAISRLSRMEYVKVKINT